MRLIPYAQETTLDDYFKMPLSKSDVNKARKIQDEKRNWLAVFSICLLISLASYFALPYFHQMMFLLTFTAVIMLFAFLKGLACSVVVMIDGANQIRMFGKSDLRAVEKSEVFIPKSSASVDRFLKHIEDQDRPILQFEKVLIEKAVWKG